MNTTLNNDELQLLLDVAYLALDAQMLSEAQTILGALVKVRHDSPHPAIGLALIAYRQQQCADAIARLQQVIALFPNAVFARSLLAMMLKEVGAHDWAMFAYESLALNEDGISADMARHLLAA
jgi:cytochrome c-type biogenesis protein CcmH/NrfG